MLSGLTSQILDSQQQHGSPLFFLDLTNILEHNFATSYAPKLFQ